MHPDRTRGRTANRSRSPARVQPPLKRRDDSLRNELRFDSVSALATQIERDVEAALTLLQEKP